jgi:uncharacterized protein (TIGR03000 family)
MRRPIARFLQQAVLLAAAFLLTVPDAIAQGDGRGTRFSSAYPWATKGYQGYNEPRTAPSPSAPVGQPRKYQLLITVQVGKNTGENPNTVQLIGHVPEDAQLWIQDEPTHQRGSLRKFVSPALTPGRTYNFTIRAQWAENGRWVQHVHSFPVHAGDLHCIDIIPTSAPTVKEEIATNLAKLDPGDRKAAEQQRFCAVQDTIHLGSMGVPVKVTFKGEQVFLCCDGCVPRAQANADQTIAKVTELKANRLGADPK